MKMKRLYQQSQFPIFQNRMYDTEISAINCPRGDIILVEDLQTGLVYNSAFRPELMTYDESYQNEQAVSRTFQKHLEQISRIIELSIGRKQLVEVGCGKGFFLEDLLRKEFDITGYDPAYEGSNPNVRRHPFKPGVSSHAEGLILRHVLEHIQNPFDFLMQLKEANGGHGRIYIEVPCFDWICEHRAWFDIFYEHVNYFRESDFSRMFGNIIASGKLFGGQYIYVVAELASLRQPEYSPADAVSFPVNFASEIAELPPADQTHAAIWGGASKGVIFALMKARAGQPPEMVIDINPAKQGKYLPATGLLVSSPEALTQLPAGSTIYVMNSNYLDEIRQMSDNAYHYIGVDHA